VDRKVNPKIEPASAPRVERKDAATVAAVVSAGASIVSAGAAVYQATQSNKPKK
jgi:hypothetical protein